MEIKVTNFDLESINDSTLSNLLKDLESINLDSGYSRSDLESIEGKLVGAFTDVEEFDFREIPTGISKVNINIVKKRISELREAITTGINNRYYKYTTIYGSLIAELNDIVELIDRHKNHTPSPILDNVDVAYLYDGEFDNIKLTTHNFARDTMLYTKLKALRDTNLNNRASTFNYMVDSVVGDLDILSNGVKEHQYSILKRVLNSNEVTYNNVISIFSNSNDLVSLVNTTVDELLKTLTELKGLLDWNYVNDDVHSRWMSTTANLHKFTAMANDKHSLKLLRLLALFRYFDEFSGTNK